MESLSPNVYFIPSISEEIKNFIKEKMLPDENTNQSILVIKDLVNKIIDSPTQRIEETNKLEYSLTQLASKLSNNNDEDKIGLKDNKIVEDALKKIIYDNCETTSKLLKANFGSVFDEVATEKILEIDEHNFFSI